MSTATRPGRHLDLGCGKFPRNPYRMAELHGVDIRPLSAHGEGFEYRQANLVLDPIPYPDRHFDSLSAYDFIEHVPRLLADGRGGTRLPFIELMNEVWRVLVPGGRLYAVTPAWPHAEAFADPTHVNIVTAGTIDYFTGESPLARIYGFNGHFALLRQDWVNADEARNPDPDSEENLFRAKHYDDPMKALAQRWRQLARCLRGKPPEREPPRRHWLRWELQALQARAG